mmetsp:Transcript_3226/g.12323  ORF Transcript_3226/g.12323 Transcript_3226/m.12323 type:complete len:242 (+) Transcript_3226:597-1322(+)
MRMVIRMPLQLKKECIRKVGWRIPRVENCHRSVLSGDFILLSLQSVVFNVVYSLHHGNGTERLSSKEEETSISVVCVHQEQYCGLNEHEAQHSVVNGEEGILLSAQLLKLNSPGINETENDGAGNILVDGLSFQRRCWILFCSYVLVMAPHMLNVKMTVHGLEKNCNTGELFDWRVDLVKQFMGHIDSTSSCCCSYRCSESNNVDPAHVVVIFNKVLKSPQEKYELHWHVDEKKEREHDVL